VEGLNVLFVADPQAFDAMAETMKHTARAYPLFDVAKLVLYKPERHQVKLTRQPTPTGTPRPLWRVTWDDQIFLSQHEAVQHVMRRFADRVYAKNQTPIDPPKGNFAFVNRCGFTDVWLGPPNYHEYQVRLVRHHQQHLPDVPFERFKARIQTVRDPEAVQAWLTSMSSKTVYECQLCAENKPSFDDLGVLEKHVVDQHLASCIESAPTFTMPGPASRLLAHRGISGTIRTAWESERRFPLNTVARIRLLQTRQERHLHQQNPTQTIRDIGRFGRQYPQHRPVPARPTRVNTQTADRTFHRPHNTGRTDSGRANTGAVRRSGPGRRTGRRCSRRSCPSRNARTGAVR
jgi:uncharacterized ParB-like nuclease family protein